MKKYTYIKAQREFPFLINLASPFEIVRLLDGIFHFYSNIDRAFCKQTVKTPSDQTPHTVRLSHKKVARRV